MQGNIPLDNTTNIQAYNQSEKSEPITMLYHLPWSILVPRAGCSHAGKQPFRQFNIICADNKSEQSKPIAMLELLPWSTLVPRAGCSHAGRYHPEPPWK